MIRNVLIALDASERAPGVFQMGTEVARRFGARVWVVRVISLPQEFPPAAHVAHGDPLPAHLEKLALDDLHAFVARAIDLEVAPPLVRSGQPWRKILETAEELDADLIVLGSHGYHGLDRVLGTTAAKVANLALRHVFVVHNRYLPGRDSTSAGKGAA